MAEKPTLLDEIEQFDVNDLELGEAAELEEEFGCDLGDIDWTKAKAMAWFLYLMRRRENPEYTLEDALRVKLVAFLPPEENGNGDRPTKPATKGGGKKRSGKPASTGAHT